ncbi:hypothetical protein SPHINGO361_120720 [Sphingomonas sp. EC-HK361]|nr:hypothetical protein SPHINGO361_120720 [Sphingomonas sp. EC-HK361]
MPDRPVPLSRSQALIRPLLQGQRGRANAHFLDFWRVMGKRAEAADRPVRPRYFRTFP